MTAMADSAPTKPRGRRRIDGWRWAGRVLIAVVLFYTAVPMIWMLLTSIKSGFAAMQFPPQWWPDEPTLASYQKLLDPQNSVGQDFLHFFWNSLFVSTITTILSVAVAVPAAELDQVPLRRQRVLGDEVVVSHLRVEDAVPGAFGVVRALLAPHLLGRLGGVEGGRAAVDGDLADAPPAHRRLL